MEKFFLICFFSICAANPLTQFVERDDPAAGWEQVAVREQEEFTLHELTLRSGSWRQEGEVDRQVWEHGLTLIVPREVRSATVLLKITGAKNGETFERPHTDALELARVSGSVVAQLRQVPNQPLEFDEARIEDGIIAYGWDRYLETGDPEWVPQFPMARAVVRAMDAVEEYLGRSVEFVLLGHSKRGWTAWTAAQIDSRVKGVVPCVIDLLNFKETFEHHHAVYQGWSPALRDYVAMKIPDRRHTPEFASLVDLVDPQSFEVEIPKYLVNATGDPFFLPDSSQFYYQELKGPKALRYVPNAEHRLPHDSVQSIDAFYVRLIDGESLPTISWEREGAQLRVVCNEEPVAVKLWHADNRKGRDFRRFRGHGPKWKAQDSTLEATLKAPKKGYRAYLLELTFEDGLVCTTDVFVLQAS